MYRKGDRVKYLFWVGFVDSDPEYSEKYKQDCVVLSFPDDSNRRLLVPVAALKDVPPGI